MRAIGYYPSEDEVVNMINEVSHSSSIHILVTVTVTVTVTVGVVAGSIPELRSNGRDRAIY